MGRGYHHFAVSQYGRAVCTFCGKVAASGGYVQREALPYPWSSCPLPWKLEEITVGDSPWGTQIISVVIPA